MNRSDATLFDLDGTLADTAADLGAALNAVLAAAGRRPVPQSLSRPHVSGGVSALLRLGLGITPADPGYEAHRQRFLGYYGDNLCVHSRPFPGISDLLRDLADAGIAWGIVTNKPEAFTLPLLEQLPLPSRPATVICADTLPHKKPHPAPLRHACRQLGVAPWRAVYVGDDRRDIAAGFRAGNRTVAVRWGYLGAGEDLECWGADCVISAPRELLRICTAGESG